jgi:hypothetical protein
LEFSFSLEFPFFLSLSATRDLANKMTREKKLMQAKIDRDERLAQQAAPACSSTGSSNWWRHTKQIQP